MAKQKECGLSMEGACGKRLVKQAGGHGKRSREQKKRCTKQASVRRTEELFQDLYGLGMQRVRLFWSFLFLPCPLPRLLPSTGLSYQAKRRREPRQTVCYTYAWLPNRIRLAMAWHSDLCLRFCWRFVGRVWQKMPPVRA